MADPGRIPGPQLAPQTIEIDLLWSLASGKTGIKNVLHGNVGGGFTATSAIAQAIYAAILASGSWTAYVPYLHTTASFVGVQLRDVRSPNLPFVASTGAATAGTGAASALPPGVSLPITLRTANAGRGFRGRIYLPGLDSATLVAATGAVLPAAATAAVNYVTAVQTALTGQGITLGIPQFGRQAYTGRKGRAIAARPAAAPITVTSIVNRLATFTSQRRRSYIA